MPTVAAETQVTGLPATLAAPEPATTAPAAELHTQATAGGAGWPLYKIVYDSTIFELVTQTDQSRTPVPLSYEKWRDVYGFATPTPADTNFVKYAWSPTVYAVTFWPGGENYWMWTRLSFPQWQTAGYPTPRNAGWIKGSYYYKWGTSTELFVEGEDGVNHKLTGAEWAASGYRPYVDRGNEGFMKLTWAPELARMSNLSTGAGRPLGYNEWRDEAFPTPQAVQRITGDKFYKDCGSNTIWYAGPAMNRPVSLREWQGAGSPSPTVTGTCSPTPPSQPADKDCSDFATQAQAQAWFNTYYPYYGDFAMLDSDGDLIACEYLP
ncbi:excalibur calcium-binding domain-containing protein [Pseudarthrobacter scleromae]|uniref:excalibur calcium-binding domain-containing protein n=1 Tax=Pseudarthrobacter scleromae TaxID=158897 RepID=UPI003D001808